jgi:hypothetical protein
MMRNSAGEMAAGRVVATDVAAAKATAAHVKAAHVKPAKVNATKVSATKASATKVSAAAEMAARPETATEVTATHAAAKVASAATEVASPAAAMATATTAARQGLGRHRGAAHRESRNNDCDLVKSRLSHGLCLSLFGLKSADRADATAEMRGAGRCHRASKRGAARRLSDLVAAFDALRRWAAKLRTRRIAAIALQSRQFRQSHFFGGASICTG